MNSWISIDKLDSVVLGLREMFIVRAIKKKCIPGSGYEYTSDPYCVWREKDNYVRWPHNYAPTHFMLLPPVSCAE